MEDQYGMADLRQYIDCRPFFPVISQPPSSHRALTSFHPYDMPMFPSDSTPSPAVGLAGFEADPPGLFLGREGGAGRWPRQETLTLLEIRSRLDPKFKEANQKGPLWDEVSRIMSEENGYQRSGKKCREKFENLYKYYKKTKEGKTGRQDGKHYRFFRQLEALYGQASNSATNFHGGNLNFNFQNSLATDQEAISAPDSGDYDTTSSYCSDSKVGDKKRRDKRRLKAKIEESINSQMKNIVEIQEAWMEKMTRVIESKERERVMIEEEWRKQDAARIEREHEMWASERAWIEARDVALMEAFNKLAGDRDTAKTTRYVWPESEGLKLIQVKSDMNLRLQENGISEEEAWDKIAAKMGCTSLMCREKWDQTINDYVIKCTKKRKDNWKSYPISDYEVAGVERTMRLNGYGNGPVNDGLFRSFVGDSYQRL